MSRWDAIRARGGVQVPLGVRAGWHLHPYPPAAGTTIEMSRRSHLPATGVMCRLVRSVFIRHTDPTGHRSWTTRHPGPHRPHRLRARLRSVNSPQDLAGVVEALTGSTCPPTPGCGCAPRPVAPRNPAGWPCATGLEAGSEHLQEYCVFPRECDQRRPDGENSGPRSRSGAGDRRRVAARQPLHQYDAGCEQRLVRRTVKMFGYPKSTGVTSTTTSCSDPPATLPAAP